MSGSGLGRFVPSAARRFVVPARDTTLEGTVAELQARVEELSRELGEVRAELGDAIDYVDRVIAKPGHESR